MPHYIFTHDERDNSFPERYRVVSPDEDAEFLKNTEDLTGTVLGTEAIQFLEELMERCQSNESLRVEMVDAPYWKFIELRFNPEEAEKVASTKKSPIVGGTVS